MLVVVVAGVVLVAVAAGAGCFGGTGALRGCLFGQFLCLALLVGVGSSIEGACCGGCLYFSMESLILAQDERWRRA